MSWFLETPAVESKTSQEAKLIELSLLGGTTMPSSSATPHRSDSRSANSSLPNARHATNHFAPRPPTGTATVPITTSPTSIPNTFVCCKPADTHRPSRPSSHGARRAPSAD